MVSLPDGALSVVLFALVGAAFGAVKFVKARKPGEGFRGPQFTKTVVVWAVGGGITAGSGGALNQPAIAASAATVAPVVNSLWDAYLPPEFGGSQTHGNGAVLEYLLSGSDDGSDSGSSYGNSDYGDSSYDDSDSADDVTDGSAEDSQTGTPTERAIGTAEPEPQPDPNAGPSAADRATRMLNDADRPALRGAAKHFDDINGNLSNSNIRKQLERKTPEQVVEAFESAGRFWRSEDGGIAIEGDDE